MMNPEHGRVDFGALLAPNLMQLIEEGQLDEVRAALERIMDPDVADILSRIPLDMQAIVLRLLPSGRAAEIFSFLPDEQQRQLIEEIEREQMVGIINEMAPDDRTDFLEEIPKSQLEELLSALKPEKRRQARALLLYPPESVGRLSTPNYLTVRPQWTASQVLEHIRKVGQASETLQTLYVIDDAGRLIDDVPLRKVLLADPNEKVSSLVDGHVVTLNAIDDREQAVRTMEHYDLPVLPVVDETRQLVGIVTFDDIADVAEEEATEDFHKTAAVAPLPLDYSQTGTWALYHRRIGWLVILVFVNLISSGVIAAYEEILEATIALAFFLPLLIDSGGNTGSQAATLMIRALATEDVHLGQWMRIILKEVRVGLVLGFTMAVASALLGLWRAGWEVATVVGLSMFCIVLAANLIGILLPFLLTRLRIDPAVASSPLITTIADATGLILYFNIATWLFGRIAQP